MLRQIGVVKHQSLVAETAQSRIVAEFRRYLLHERGLSPSTLLNYAPIAEQFLAERFHNRAPDLAVLRALKEQALAKTNPVRGAPKAFQPDDELLAFLKQL